MTLRARHPILAAALTALLIGCQSGNSNTPSSIHGKVTYKGAPVTAGTITFFAKEGGMYPRPLNADGTYDVSSLPAGEMAVTVETESANTNAKMPTYGRPGKDSKSPMIGPVPEGAPTPGTGGGAYVKIPSKYATKELSGLTVTLVRGGQEKDFDLTD